jgi:hypothetical protein
VWKDTNELLSKIPGTFSQNKNRKIKMYTQAGSMAQVIEHMPVEHKGLTAKPGTTKTNQKECIPKNGSLRW